MSTVIASVAAWFGITLPFSVYVTASSTVAVLAGPIGWILAGVALAGGALLTGLPDSSQVSAFVMTVNMLKSKKLEQVR
jgi:hypothetical protein